MELKPLFGESSHMGSQSDFKELYLSPRDKALRTEKVKGGVTPSLRGAWVLGEHSCRTTLTSAELGLWAGVGLSA